MIAPAPITGSAPDANAQFSDLAATAHKITRHILANPNDTQARDDLRYIVSKMQGPQGAAATANSADQANIPRNVGAPLTALQNAGNTASMGLGNALLSANDKQTVEESNAANPTAEMVGKVAGVVGPLLAGDFVQGWPAMQALAKIPQIGRLGLIKILGGVVQDAPDVAPAAAKTAARLIEEAPAEDAEHLDLIKKSLFDKPPVEQPASSSAIAAKQPDVSLANYTKQLEGLTKGELQSHLNWSLNRLKQGPWMQQNVNAIVAEMAKRGMVTGAAAVPK